MAQLLHRQQDSVTMPHTQQVSAIGHTFGLEHSTTIFEDSPSSPAFLNYSPTAKVSTLDSASSTEARRVDVANGDMSGDEGYESSPNSEMGSLSPISATTH
jgi:hypothetical protein